MRAFLFFSKGENDMKVNIFTGLIIAFTIFGFIVLAEAETITKPHTFVDGTPAVASEVNANFDTVYNQVNKVGSIITVDAINGRIGIGTESPSSPLEVVTQDILPRIISTSYHTQLTGDHAGGGVFTGRLFRGTPANPGPVQLDDTIAGFSGQGYGLTMIRQARSMGGMFIRAEENWTDDAQGTRIVFVTTQTGTTSTSERLRITSEGNVGIGTVNPAVQLETSGEGTIVANFISAYGDPISNEVIAPAFVGRRARGSAISPSEVQTGDVLSFFGGKGYFGTAFPELATAGVSIVATENHDDASRGTRILFLTTPNGSTTRGPKAVINANGNVGIGTTAPQSTLQVNGYTQLALTTGTPPGTDCDESSEFGRMKVDASAEYLYICVASGWVAK
jgi:hypothetical protein